MLEVGGWVPLITDIASVIFEDLALLTTFAIALPLGFWLARKVVSLVRVR